MRKRRLIGITAGILAAASIVVARDPGVQSVIGDVFLQDTTPGTPQVGHATITGTFRSGQVNVSQSSPTTIPIIANNTATGAGSAIGGSFSSAQQSGTAIRATATSTTGFNIGVLGEARSPNGTGVTGRSSKGIGVFGLTEGTGAGLWGRSTRAGTPALICENTVAGEAARIFGHVRLMNLSRVSGERLDGSAAYSLFSSAHEGGVALLAGSYAVAAVANETFSHLTMFHGAGAAVRLAVDGSGQGTVSADVKNFVQPDPDDMNQDIVYSSLEGPEAAAYVRGTGRLVNGVARISLPKHFQNVATLPGLTVQLTPLSRASRGLAVTSKSLTAIEVGELGGGQGNYEFDWRVEAVRRGFTDYKVHRPWEERLAPGADRAKALEARRARAHRLYGIEYRAHRP